MKLCEMEGADFDIVIPAAILHDIGWSNVPSKERMATLDGSETDKVNKDQIRKKHEKYGVELAKQILNQINYDKDSIHEILQIISQHDSRRGFISKNEGIMRDADKMWRFDKRSFVADTKRLKNPAQELLKIRRNYLKVSDFFSSESGKKTAYEELEKREKEYSKEK